MSGEELAQVLYSVSDIALVAAAVCALLAVILFIRFRIPYVIGDLSGRNAKKSIDRMRSSNEKTGRKTLSPGEINMRRGKLTASMHGEKTDAGQPAAGGAVVDQSGNGPLGRSTEPLPESARHNGVRAGKAIHKNGSGAGRIATGKTHTAAEGREARAGAVMPETGLLEENRADRRNPEPETELLRNDSVAKDIEQEGTMPLEEQGTMPLEEEGTMLLDSSTDEEAGAPSRTQPLSKGIPLTDIESVMLIHTNEDIT